VRKQLGGPWLILAGCPAPGRHNTVTASRGNMKHGIQPCVCPRSLILRDQEAERRSQEMKARRAERKSVSTQVQRDRQQRNAGEAVTRAVATRRASPPNLRDGACTTPQGQQIYDAYLEKAKGAAESMRWLCSTQCVQVEACRRWVLGNEQPVGSWGGMFAGLNANDRIRIAKTKAQERAR
jgi:hypothetical protein